MAPGWRHDDLMTLKKLIRLEIIGLDDWQKFEGNWQCRFRVNVCTKKCTEEIKIKNKELEFKSSQGRLRWSVFKSYDRL